MVLIIVIGKAAGLIGKNDDSTQQSQQIQQNSDSQSEDDGLVPVPNLVGKTEDEAQQLCADANIGMNYKGEEASTRKRVRFLPRIR